MTAKLQHLRLYIAAALSCAAALVGHAAMVPPGAAEQLQQVVGNRIEAVTIISGDHAAGGGIYTFRGGTLTEIKTTKVGGGGAVTSPQPLGQSGLLWAPVLIANVGLVTSQNDFTTGVLAGNTMRYDALAAQLGVGARIYLNPQFSFGLDVAGIYGRTENEFIARNAIGDALKSAGSGTLVDWTVETWTVEPSLSAHYEWMWGWARLEFSSRFSYFHTESFNSTTPFITLEGDSTTWENKIDLDLPTGLRLLGTDVHTGGFFSRTDLTGGVSDGLRESHVYTANTRVVFDTTGRIWKLRWAGLGASYFWGDRVDGWTAGLDLRFQF